MTERPTYGSLFTGVGGMDMGFDTHMDCQWQVEWDKNCQSILRRHWPDVPKYLDVQEVYGSELIPVDVITFGSPCQDLSVAGKRAGIDGGRSSMFFEAARIIKEMQDATDGRFPRVTVWENVPGALSSRGGDDFQRVLEEMDDLGSVLSEWHILDARWFGVPQRRRRIFLVSVFDPDVAARCGSQILPVSPRSGWDPPTRRSAGEGFAGGVGAGVGGVGGGSVAGAGGVDGAGGVGGGGVGFRKVSHGEYVGDDSASTVVLRDYKSASDLVVPVDAVNAPVDDTMGCLTTAFGEKNYSNMQEVSAGSIIPVVSEQILFDGKRNDDFRLYGDTAPTLPAMMGTGGNNTPMVGQSIAYSVREDAKANTFSATPTDTALAVTALQPSTQSHHAQLFIVQETVDAGSSGTWWDGETTAPTLTTKGSDQRMPDKGQLFAVVQPVTASFKPGASADAYGIGYEEEIAPTLESGGGGNNKPAVLQPIPIQDGRDMEKHQNGLGVGAEGDPSYTLDTTGGQAVGQPIMIDRAAFNQGGNAQYDPQIRETETMAPLVAEGPHAVAQPIGFSHTQGLDAQPSVDSFPTLRSEGGGHAVLQPMVFEPGAMSRTDAPRYSTEVAATLRANMGDNQLAVAQPTTVCFQPGTASRMGGGVWEDMAPTLRAEAHAGDNSPHVIQEGVVAPTLTAANNPSRSPQSSEVTEQVGAVFASQYAVRRLCPEECELLMGWPIGHTKWTDTGKEQADSHRYKQCGNGVASPVARWIAGHLARLL